MENSNYIKEILKINQQIRELKENRILEIWNHFNANIINGIYLELCAKITETKMIPIDKVFNITVHPNLNKHELLNKYYNLGIKKERFQKILPIVNTIWFKIASICKEFDLKYIHNLSTLKDELNTLENREAVIDIMETYENKINNTKSIEELEESIKIENSSNLLDLFNDTKQILKLHYELLRYTLG
jgi:hypothetical protein